MYYNVDDYVHVNADVDDGDSGDDDDDDDDDDDGGGGNWKQGKIYEHIGTSSKSMVDFQQATFYETGGY